MKTQIKLIAISLLGVVILNSCSIEKRRYLSGYNIDWNLAGKTKVDNPVIKKGEIVRDQEASTIEDPGIISESISSPGTGVASKAVPVKKEGNAENKKLVSNSPESATTHIRQYFINKSESANKRSVGSATEFVAQNESRDKKGNGIQYKILALVVAGLGIQKISAAIQQRNIKNTEGKKKAPVWLWILLIVVLLVAAGSLAMTLAAV